MFYLSEMKNPGRIKAFYKSLEGIPVNGFIVTPIPESVSIDETDFRRFDGDTNPPDYLTREAVLFQKYQGLLGQNPLFSDNYYSTLEDDTDFNGSETRGATGNYYFWLNALDSPHPEGALQTDVIALSTPSSVFRIHWDVYELERVQEDGRTYLRYQQRDPDLLDASFTAVGGAFVPANFMETVEADEGSNFVLRLENPTSDRLYLGGLGILY